MRWLDKHLANLNLNEINRDILEDVALQKEAEDVTLTTVNRVMEVVRAILTKAHKEWEWVDKVPAIRMRQVEKNRIRWLTPDEANRLLNELPLHVRDMAAFSLATGLRAGNVTGLKWSNLDLDKRHAWIQSYCQIWCMAKILSSHLSVRLFNNLYPILKFNVINNEC